VVGAIVDVPVVGIDAVVGGVFVGIVTGPLLPHVSKHDISCVNTGLLQPASLPVRRRIPAPQLSEKKSQVDQDDQGISQLSLFAIVGSA